jgi:hypothetical protein
VLSEWTGGMWTNSTRPPQRRHLSQWTMRLLSPWAPDDWLRHALAGIGAHPRPETARSVTGLAPTSSWQPRHRAPTTWPSGYLRPTWDARPIADAAEQEQPLVVVRAASFIEPERRLLALASDAHDSAAGGTHLTAGERRRRRRRTGSRVAGRRSAEAGRGPARTAKARLRLRRSALTGNTAGRKDDVPLAVLGHRIFVFLPKKPALNENVETGGVVAASHLSHIKVDRAGDLLAAEDEFGFFFALGLSTPDRHRDGHHDHHDANADQQRRHRVAALAALTTL